MGSCMVTPSAMPPGMMVTLWRGSDLGSLAATRENRSARRQNREIDGVGERNRAGVNSQNLFASAHIGTTDHYATIKTSGAEQGRIKHIGPVGSCHEDDAFVGLEAIHFDQQLVQRLFAFVVTAAKACASVASDRIDFINEDNARGVLLALLEKIAHPAGADAYEHLDEVGAGDGKEGNIGFASHRARQ